MENVLKFFGRIEVIIALAVLLVALIAFLFLRKSKNNKYRKEYNDLEVRYNRIKSVPLPYKLNKAVAIARTDEELMASLGQVNEDFEKFQANLKQIQTSLANVDDNILVNKNKTTAKDLSELDASISLGEQQVTQLDEFFDKILEQETAQRAKVTKLKERFRTLKEEAQERSGALSYCWATLEKNNTGIEKMFSAFEEWMYASEFEKAQNQLTDIETSLDSMDTIIHKLPDIIQEARGVVPTMLDEVKRNIAEKKEQGVYLDHLECETNLATLEEALKNDLLRLREGYPDSIEAHLTDYKTRLRQLNSAVNKEGKAKEELSSFETETFSLINGADSKVQYIQDSLDKVSVRFGLEALEEGLTTTTEKIKGLKATQEQIKTLLDKKQLPASTLMVSLKELNQDASSVDTELTRMRTVLDSAKSDEDRAKKQLLKLEITINEMQVKVRMNKLPAISPTYNEDLLKAHDYINSLRGLIDNTPLDVNLLNATLKDAIDFIYRLYNNVNNVVGMAIMVENTIVFGNKYRSTYPDVDSQLTRSELSFRNGEYTQAAEIAISTIEKLHPQDYESLIKENAKSAA